MSGGFPGMGGDDDSFTVPQPDEEEVHDIAPEDVKDEL